jgi:hypothetical protein
MGTPDVLGTYGTFSFYTSEPFALSRADRVRAARCTGWR